MKMNNNDSMIKGTHVNFLFISYSTSLLNVIIKFIDRKRESTDGEEYAFAVITPDADEVTIHMKVPQDTKQSAENDDFYQLITNLV